MNLIRQASPRSLFDPPTFFMVGAIGLGLMTGLTVILSPGWLWPVAIVMALLLVWIVFTNPDLGVAILVFSVYTRFSDVMEHHNGIPSFVLPLAILITGVLVFRWWFWGETIHSWEQVAILTGVYGFVGFSSLLYAAAPDRSQIILLEYIKDVLILLTIVLALRRRESFSYVIWALLLAGIFMGTLTVYQQLTGTFANNYGGFAQAEVKNIIGEVSDYRVAGPVSATNFYAMILVVLVPLALDRLWQEKKVLLRLLALWSLVVCCLSIIFTFSRGGFLALCLVLMLMVLRQATRPSRILLSMGVLVVLLQFLPANYTDRLATTLDLLPGSKTDARNETSFRGRTSEVLVAWHIFTDHPILGVGLNNYKYYYQDYAQPLGWDNRREERSAHNLYLEIAAETGLIGLAAFTAILINAGLSMRFAYRTLLQTGHYSEASMVAALVIGLVGYLLASFFLHGAYPRYFWLLMGIALGLPQIVTHSRQELSMSTVLTKWNENL
ncbi:MAG: O-antigen ligase family protein [Chloroflexi bacterium]|nr:O-antigen ligase family protein [Chloroflexota bacterium]MBP8055663.1 O-antigen ligase family protein [Chloroflexota bacterium]